VCKCGFSREESFAPENEDAYSADTLRCHACAARDRVAREWAQDEHADPAGIFYSVKRWDEDDEG
jgi:hypothetical protein